jgi:hypothetical protein
MEAAGRALLELVGYALGQGLWAVADGAPLCTFAVWEGAFGRDAARVDADTVPESLEAARKNLAELPDVLRWVIVVEGEVEAADGRRFGAIRAEFGAQDADLDGVAISVFRPAPDFGVVRPPIVTLGDGGTVPEGWVAWIVEAMHAAPRPVAEA